MVVPIGIDPLNGVVSAYKSVTGDLETISIEKIAPGDFNKGDKIDKQFSTIQKYFSSNSTNICVCLDENYGNEDREAFVESAKNHNFTNFTILDFSSALYIHAIFKSTFESKNRDKIWIFWADFCYIYEHIDDNIVFLGSCLNTALPNEVINNGMDKPAAFFYPFNVTRKIGNELFLGCSNYFYTRFLPENAALIKAEFIDGCKNIRSSLKIVPSCGRKIELVINEKCVLLVDSIQTLPYKKAIKVFDEEQDFKLKIFENNIKEFSMNAKSLIFSIDINGIYSVEITEKAFKDQNIQSNPEKDSNSALMPEDSLQKSSTPASPLLPEEDLKDESFSKPDIKLAMPNYIIPEKFAHYVDMIRQIGHIQTELNILNPLVANIFKDFDFESHKTLQEWHHSYEPAIFALGTLVDIVKDQEQSENNKLGGNNLKDLIISVVAQYTQLKQNYDKNDKLLQQAELYLSSYNQEIEWIDSKLNNDELKFDNFETSKNSFKLVKVLKNEITEREFKYQELIKDGRKFITKGNKESIEKFMKKLEAKWDQLQDHVKFYSTLVIKVQKAVECCKKAYDIEEWISVKLKVISKNDTHTGSEIIKEMQMKKTKKLLEEVEAYSPNIETFEKETNAIKNEIILGGTETGTKLFIFLDALSTRLEKVKKSYNDLKASLDEQIRKLDHEKLAYEFIKNCNVMERLIQKIMDSINSEITKENLEMMQNSLADAENEECDIQSLMETAEELVAAGFLEAKLKIKNIEKLLKEKDELLKQKQAELKEMIELKEFISNCNNIIERIKTKIANVAALKNSNELQEYKEDLKEYHQLIYDLLGVGIVYDFINVKFVNEMEEKISEMKEAYANLSILIETKLEECETNELTDFYERANEMLKFLDQITSECEWSDAVDINDITKTSNLLTEKHLQLKDSISSKQNEITEIEETGKQLLTKNPEAVHVELMLEKLEEAIKKLDIIWQKRCDYFERIEYIGKFNEMAAETEKVLKEYYGILKSEGCQTVDESKISNMLAAVNLQLDQLQECNHKVIEERPDLAGFVNAKVDELTDLHKRLKVPTAEEKTVSEDPSEAEIKNDSCNETTASDNKDIPSTLKHPSDPTPSIIPSENQSYKIPKKLRNYDENIHAVGIDLGTSRCCMAVSRNNKIESVALENTGERLLPSFVSFDEAHEKCGEIVIQGLQRNKEKYTCFDIKRIIGRDFHDIIPDRSWPFTVLDNDGNVMIKTEDKDGESIKSPEEISAVLLKYMKDKVSIFEGKELKEAVLTVPAAFNEKQKAATLKAAKLAGWETIHLLPEPVAASFAYFNNREIPNNSNVLLFDLGGGTLDVCVFKIIDGSLQIIANNGDTCLGGRDIDNLLIRHFTTVLKFKFGIEIRKKLKRRYQLMIECQRIKQSLTVREHDILDSENFDSNVQGTVTIDRHELEEMISDLLQRMRLAVNLTLSNAKLGHKEINKVLLVGGGCRMPTVKSMLQQMFPKADHCCEEQPDEVVAIGAAIYAYHLATTNSSKITKF